MQDRLNIPKTIRVGFQNCSDTYSKKLAYVIYFDHKGKLRKEKSWEGWRDKKIDPADYDNEPTNGFVLNKDVGGSQRSWSHNARREKVRVYDPRGFEFEITVANLLFVLQECSAIKGKGLEGDFVYSWDGTDIVLLPVTSQEYEASTKFCNLQTKKITSKDMVVGCTYLNKDKNEVLYMGRWVWYDFKQIKTKVPGRYGHPRTVYSRGITGKKQHVFKDLSGQMIGDYWIQSGFTKLAEKTSDAPVPQYAEAFEKLNASKYVTPPVKIVLEKPKAMDLTRGYGNQLCVFVDGKYFLGNGSLDKHWDRDGYKNVNDPSKDTFRVTCNIEISVVDGKYSETIDTSQYLDKSAKLYEKEKMTLKEAQAVASAPFIECENGAKHKIGRW